MAKRFTDTEKWDKPWFRKLPPKYKCLWSYIVDKCDQAGAWYVDFELASYMIGDNIDPGEAEIYFEKQIRKLDEGKLWAIEDFIPFQYGELTPTNNFHKSILAVAVRRGIQRLGPGADQGQNSASLGAQERKGKEKDKEAVDRKLGDNCIPPRIEDVTAYCQERGKGIDAQRWFDHYTANGWMVGKNRMKDWRAAVRNWERSPELAATTKKVVGHAAPSGRDYDAKAIRGS